MKLNDFPNRQHKIYNFWEKCSYIHILMSYQVFICDVLKSIFKTSIISHQEESLGVEEFP